MSFPILFILPVHPPPITHTPPPGHPPRLTPRGLRAPHTPRGFRPAPRSRSARRSAQAATRPCLDRYGEIYWRGIAMGFHEIWIPTYIDLILTNELLKLHLDAYFAWLQIHLRSDSAVHRPRRPIASWSTLIVEQGVLQLGPPLLLICSHCKPDLFGDYTIPLCESIKLWHWKSPVLIRFPLNSYQSWTSFHIISNQLRVLFLFLFPWWICWMPCGQLGSTGFWTSLGQEKHLRSVKLPFVCSNHHFHWFTLW